jgi:hypothetical protein
MMSLEQSVECELVGETEVLGENLPHCYFVHHKSYTTWPGKPATNRLSYGMAWSLLLTGGGATLHMVLSDSLLY